LEAAAAQLTKAERFEPELAKQPATCGTGARRISKETMLFQKGVRHLKMERIVYK
jgi:hypothetical protein